MVVVVVTVVVVVVGSLRWSRKGARTSPVDCECFIIGGSVCRHHNNIRLAVLIDPITYLVKAIFYLQDT